ncbi:hypothetical protein LR48_Vigan07g089800 [Vigna angularis]|uniref:Uncharacterized protein n=1 Tax=Phaseolus angularis TaxID=3914 RepID=A0A0L9UXC0_PHAAN|nr:hypothetical protein LR48_Vigan07g089800 [Vigna angularis]
MAADALPDNSLPASSDSGIKVIVRMRPFSLMGFSSSSPSSWFEFANVGGTRRRQRYFGWRLVVEQGGVLSFLILGSFTHGGEAIWRHCDHGKASPRRKGVSRQSIFASPLFVQAQALGRAVNVDEVFAQTHVRKGTNKFVDERSRKTHVISEHGSTPTPDDATSRGGTLKHQPSSSTTTADEAVVRLTQALEQRDQEITDLRAEFRNFKALVMRVLPETSQDQFILPLTQPRPCPSPAVPQQPTSVQPHQSNRHQSSPHQSNHLQMSKMMKIILMITM